MKFNCDKIAKCYLFLGCIVKLYFCNVIRVYCKLKNVYFIWRWLFLEIKEFHFSTYLVVYYSSKVL